MTNKIGRSARRTGQRAVLLLLISLVIVVLVSCDGEHSSWFIPDSEIKPAFGQRQGCLVVIKCSTGEVYRHNPELSSVGFPPCSTFKIWNTLIGCETGELTSADAPFYSWDGVSRAFPEWNRDLTLRQAFQVSCVPAFQVLARRIGTERMRIWVERLGYGDCDTSAGVDIFWLPARGRKALLITPDEQAAMVHKLVAGKLPFSEKSRALLGDVMLVKKTERGSLFGKTGTGADDSGEHSICWFVGFVETRGEQYAFACLLIGDMKQTGRDTRDFVQSLLETHHLL